MNLRSEATATVVALCACAGMVVFRWLHLAAMQQSSVLFHNPMVDPLEFLTEARRRAAGTFEYEVPAHAPFYGMFLGWVYPLCGGGLFALRFLTAMSGLATALVLYFGGKRVIGAWPAAIATVLSCGYEPGFLFECELYDAGFANLAVTGTALLLAACAAAPRWPRAVALGVTLGLAAIVRTNLLLLVPLAAGLLLLWRCPWPRLGTVLALALLPAAVFTARNHAVSGELLVVQGRSWQNLHMANFAGSTGLVDVRPGPQFEQVRRRPMVEADALTPGAQEAFYRRLVLDYVVGQPGDFARLLLRKAWNSLASREAPSSFDDAQARLHSWVLRLPWPGFQVLLPLALVGLAFPFAGRRAHLALAAAAAAVWLGLVLVYPAGRYRYQAAGLLCLFASLGLTTCVRHAVEWRRQKTAPARRAFLGAGIALLAGVALAIAAPDFRGMEHRWAAEYAQLEAYAWLTRNDPPQPGDLAMAQRKAESAAQLDPDYAWPVYTLGVIAMSGPAPRMPDAVRLNTRAIELFADFPEAWQNRGVAHMHRGDVRAAAADFQKVVQLDPHRAIAWEYLARALEAMGDAAGARMARARAQKKPG